MKVAPSRKRRGFFKAQSHIKGVSETKETDEGVKWFYTDFLPRMKTARSVRIEDAVLPRLREQDINLFTPWGPRYSWQVRGTVIRESDKEVETLEFLRKSLDELLRYMPAKNFRWVFLGADLYGTRLNGLPGEAMSNYFASLSGWLATLLPEVEFRLWSEFDEMAEPYRKQVRANFSQLVQAELLRRTTQTAQAMGKGSDPNDYLTERLAEALLIEGLLKPIKVSCVMRHKDDHVDADLPRLYIVPEDLTAPWM